MQVDHLRRYRATWLVVGVAALAAFLILLRADATAGRSAATLKACPTGDAPYKTIQAAIDNAQSGDRIEACAATFREQIVIKDKSVTLVGAGRTKTTIEAPSSLEAEGNIVVISGSGVKVELSGFTIKGPGPGTCGSILSGIFVRDDAEASIHK